MVTEREIQEMADLIVARFQPEKIILFGSYADGTASADSDVDLLIVKESELPRHKRSVPIYKMLYGVACPVDVVVFTPAEVRDWQNVPEAFVSTAVRQGRTLYERPA